MTSPTAVPVFHYFDLGRLGRGEVVRLFMRDAEFEFEDVHYAYDDTWPAVSKTLDPKELGRTGKLPALEYNGKILTQHIPMLRFLSRELGRYDGETSHEKYQVDAVADLYIDWRSQWVPQLTKRTDEYKDEFLPHYYNLIAQHYSESGGPYLLGEKITYADFAVYQSIDNDKRIGTLPAALPASIEKFKQAFEARPNIAAYIKETAAK
ncbi:glutathione S-transferase [Thelonectria olida]|uniref:Glutathione S-transferase n=1 Tax=Thelonectria olida TaxID=1576542 RepID=A0A9P9AVT9_9HYPO|nr:glutathione S-transferase [Thelonectria olida]